MNKRIPIGLGILLVLFALWVLITPTPFVHHFIERLDDIGYDLQLRTYVFTQNLAPSRNIAIVDIDDRSLKTEGRWPWSRNKVAQLIDELHQQGAIVVAFDILLSEAEQNIAESVESTLSNNNLLTPDLLKQINDAKHLFNYDDVLASSIKNISTVLALGFLPEDQKQNQLPKPLLKLNTNEASQLELHSAKGYISNIPVLQQAAKLGGFINIYPDNDGIIRRAPLIMQYENGIYPSLALQAVLAYLGADVDLITPKYGDTIKLEGLKIGGVTIPTDASGQALVPFIGKSYTFTYYSATDILHHNLPKDALLGKILFIGTSATGLGDLVPTAIQNPFPGVEIQATIANGIIENNFSYKPAWTLGASVAFSIIFGLLAVFSFPYFGPRVLGSVIILLPPAILFLNNWIWIHTGLILSILVPLLLVIAIALMNIIYGYLFESRRREQLKEIFGQYVPEKHIDEMLKSKSSYAMQGEDRDMSVLFADIRSFTTISEGMAASELVEMLNTFFTPMTEIIFNHRGTIDKYVGDLIMAFWGAPLKDKNHRRHAIESALEMQSKVVMLKSTFAEKNWPEIHIGIGINSGTMSVGDMGSRFRRNYTVLGDAVNLASRVEGLTKFYGVDIIVTESTQDNQTKFVFRRLDKVRVKGKKHGITIYEVICQQSAATKELNDELNEYHQALDLYYAQDWEAALTMMSELNTKYPQRKIYSLYISRIKEYQVQAPPSDWDGVFVHSSK